MFEDFMEAVAADRARVRRYCAFGKWVQTLDEMDRARAEGLVTGTTYSCRELARYFKSKGARLNDQVLNRHRNAACCGQRAS